ncbi:MULTISPECIES: helix-turn-helix domain-containing protein [Streptomyces]|uniref:HTH cro/C1-type domain-containing protein n=1 Tax=Streptomyces mordarskii TaxID=1226758 RepID=A0ABN1DR51_9ACTN
MLFQPRELFPDRSARDLFGAEIRRHREKADMSLRRLSEVLNYSKSHLARIEAAESLPYDDLPSKLDACFGTDGMFARVYALAKNEPFPGRFRRVIEIEKRATAIEQYSCATVPGLLQTPEFARESLRCGNRDAPSAEIDALANARIERQTRLANPGIAVQHRPARRGRRLADALHAARCTEGGLRRGQSLREHHRGPGRSG